MRSVENFIIEDFSVEPFKYSNKHHHQHHHQHRHKFSCMKHCCHNLSSGEILPNDGNLKNIGKCATQCNHYFQKQNMLPCGITPNKHSDSKQKKCYSYDGETCFEMMVPQNECYDPNCWGTLNQCCPGSQ